MEGMSFLETLLDGATVEWNALGEVTGYSPTRVDAAELDATSFVGVDNLLADKGGRVDASYLPNTHRLTAYEPGDILLGNIRPYLKKVWQATNSGGCSGDVLAVRILDKCKEFVSAEFLYYLLSSDEFFLYNMQHAKGAKMPRGNKAAILNYQIPVPCPENPDRSLAIQAEIVRILDTFTDLTRELTRELTARKKQYHYYRDRLLTFEDGEVEWKTLGEICENISSGKNKDKSDVGIYPVFGSTEIIGRTNNKVYDKEQILVARVGANAGRVNIAQGEYDVSDNTLIIQNKENFILKYLYYTLVNMNINRFAKGAGQPLITATQLKNIQIPVPSPEEQARIVAILDKFDTLTNSISEGLPREIALRQQQYEYYRDLLFNFPPPLTPP